MRLQGVFRDQEARACVVCEEVPEERWDEGGGGEVPERVEADYVVVGLEGVGGEVGCWVGLDPGDAGAQGGV